MRRTSILTPVPLAILVSHLLFAQSELQVGYAILTGEGESSVPVSTALFRSTNPDGVLIWEGWRGCSRAYFGGACSGR